MPALRPVPGEGGSRAGKPGSTGNEGQGGRPGAFLAGTLAGFRAVTASPVPTKGPFHELRQNGPSTHRAGKGV